MNKISKKIVALATMAAFVLTLVPAAAFAAPSTVDPDKSTVQTVEKNVKVDVGDRVSFDVDLKDANDTAVTGDQTVYFWVETAEGQPVRTVDYYNDANPNTAANNNNSAILYLDNNAKVFYTSKTQTGVDRAVSFQEAGNYVIKAGVIRSGVTEVDSLDDLVTLKNKTDYSNIAVSIADVDDISFTWSTVDNSASGNAVQSTVDDTVFTLNLIGDDFIANTSDTCVVTGHIEDDQDRDIANKEVKLSSADKALWFTGEAADGVVTTNADGDFTFSFKMNDNRNVPISITIDDQTYTLRVIKEETRAYDIDTVEDGGYVLAGDASGDQWTRWSGFVANNLVTLKDALTFSVSDVKGDAVDIDDMTQEPAVFGSQNADLDHNQYVDVLERPDDSTLTARDLYLNERDGVFTLDYRYANLEERADDLTPGEYKVSVSLLSGDSAVATFYVADYGTTQDLDLTMTATDVSTQIGSIVSPSETRRVTITDEVTLGQRVNITAQYVDENGIRLNAPDGDVSFGGNGKAVVDGQILTDEFVTKADIAANESLIGTTIEVVATSQSVHKTVFAELTVVDSYNALGLEFDPTEGPVNEDNDVTVTVVKEDGTRAQVNGTIVSAYVEDQSNEDAKVYVEGVDNDVTNGRGEITVYASAPTTADIVVAVKDDTNSGLYAATLEYTAGDVDITAHHEVTMTIGSSQYVVDKQLFEMDAAPYVDSAWRTMIPIRALAEAFDATVTYDNDDRTVTIEYENEVIVMTIGEDTYTVNDEEMTMDTEPVIQGDRTYVPIRFVAEAMGFTVTPLYNANSSTASVVFQS